MKTKEQMLEEIKRFAEDRSITDDYKPESEWKLFERKQIHLFYRLTEDLLAMVCAGDVEGAHKKLTAPMGPEVIGDLFPIPPDVAGKDGER